MLRCCLEQRQIVMHSFVVAELALGSLKDRRRTLDLLDRLPQLRVAHLNEIRVLIEARRLYGCGLGLIDAHLLASVFLTPSTRLWTMDKQLCKLAEDFDIHAAL